MAVTNLLGASRTLTSMRNEKGTELNIEIFLGTLWVLYLVMTY
jgi:hypothetical protein